MKTVLSAAFAGALLLSGATIASAQTVVIAPEQETVIREYVQKQPAASIELPGVELNVGTALPETVELQTIDSPGVEYRYVVVDNQTVLVDPGTRKIVKVLN